MNPITREWVDKAEGDCASAQRELRARKSPNFDAACFHCHQCIEKYLKARLHEVKIPFPKTHNLLTLLNLLLVLEPSWTVLQPDLQGLTTFAVSYRYPGIFADKKAAREALICCRKVRGIVRQSLGLKEK